MTKETRLRRLVPAQVAGLLEKDVDRRLTVQELEEDAWLIDVAARRAAPAREPRKSAVDVSPSEIERAFSPVHKRKSSVAAFLGGASKALRQAARRSSTLFRGKPRAAAAPAPAAP